MKELQSRLQQLRVILQREGIAAFLVTQPVNRRYLTGFTGSHGIALVTPTDALLLTDGRYRVQASQEVSSDWQIAEQGNEGWPLALATHGKRLGLTAIAFEPDHLTVAMHQRLLKALPTVTWRAAGDYTERLRSVKDEQEIPLLRKAARIADRAFLKVAETLQPGMTERAIARALTTSMEEQGAEGASFPIIVASGKRSSLPHGTATDARIGNGELLTIDFGARYRGYCSDMTRTIVLDEPNALQKELHAVVCEAHGRAIAAIEPGRTGKEIDAAARSYIAQKGYSDAFIHSTGHGIGLCVHESPYLSQRQGEKLVPGMVVTVEPGVYLADVGGVRVEDDVLVTEAGPKLLTHASRSLRLADVLRESKEARS